MFSYTEKNTHVAFTNEDGIEMRSMRFARESDKIGDVFEEDVAGMYTERGIITGFDVVERTYHRISPDCSPEAWDRLLDKAEGKIA